MKGYIEKHHKKDALRVLREIKQQIESGEDIFICFAASALVICDLLPDIEFETLGTITRRIKEYVRDSLREFATYRNWLEHELGRWPTYEECKRGRVAWLDKMIQEVENA